MKIIQAICVAALALAVTACGEKPLAGVEYIPVKFSMNEDWSMVSPDGQVLFERGVKEMPTKVRHGRFLAKNAEGLWEIYTAEAAPKKVGRTYKYAGEYIEEFAPVADERGPLMYVDGEDQPRLTLNAVDRKPVANVRNFVDGLSLFYCEGRYGCMDTEGKVVVSPEYSEISHIGDGKMFARHSKYDKAEYSAIRACVIDRKGKVLFEYSPEKFTPYLPYKDGLAVVTVEGAEKTCAGIIDEKGEWVVEATGKAEAISGVEGDCVAYYDGQHWGLMNLKGETLIAPQYDYLSFVAPTLLAARSGDTVRLVDVSGKVVGTESYLDVVSGLDGKHLLVTEAEDKHYLIDLEGNRVNPQQTFAAYSDLVGDEVVEQNFVRADAVAHYLLSEDGLCGLSARASVADALDFCLVEEYNYYIFASQKELTSSGLTFGGEDVELTLTYETAPVEAQGENYVQKDVKPYMMKARILCADKLKGYRLEVYGELRKRAAELGGKEVPEMGRGKRFDFDDVVLLVYPSRPKGEPEAVEAVLFVKEGDWETRVKQYAYVY